MFAAVQHTPTERPGSGNGRATVANSGSLTSGVAARYATAVFELAREGGSIEKVEADLGAIEAALAESPDLREMISSPVFSRQDTVNAVRAIADRMGLGIEATNTLALMASNRRLFILPAVIARVKAMIAADRGEVSAEVSAAKPLTEAQAADLREKLSASVGKDVELKVTVDESLIGGLVVRIGSRMIDTSIRSKLAKLQNVMKEVG
jgi:F-type H+-transporting ATPase subunit delta